MNGVLNSTLVEVAKSQEANKTDGYELNRWPYLLAMPLMWGITLWVIAKKTLYRLFNKNAPSINTLWYDGLGNFSRGIKEGAASWKALEIIYNYRPGVNMTLGGIIDDFWVGGMINAQAVRNRLKLAKQEVRKAILKFSDQGEIRIMSLACGSAQGIIEIIAEFKKSGITVRAMLVDIDQSALDYAKQLAETYGVGDRVEVLKNNVFKVKRIASGFKPHIIEMLGLLDYLDQNKAVRLATLISESLENGGVFLTCNIRPNFEQHFLKWVINWPMIYRTPVQLIEIAATPGFDKYKVIYEPLKVHGLLIAENNN